MSIATGCYVQLTLADIPALTHTRADLMGAAPQLVFDLDEDKVELAGLDLAAVARQLETLLEGVQGGSLFEATEELPVRVRIEAQGPTAFPASRCWRWARCIWFRPTAPLPGGTASASIRFRRSSSAVFCRRRR